MLQWILISGRVIAAYLIAGIFLAWRWTKDDDDSEEDVYKYSPNLRALIRDNCLVILLWFPLLLLFALISLKAWWGEISEKGKARKRKILRRVKLKKELKKRRARLKEAKEIRRWEERRAKEAEKERVARIPETLAKIRRLPVIKLTKAEFDKTPKAGSFTKKWLQKEAPFGFKFICRPFPECPKDLIVLGHLVKGVEAIASQYGAGLFVPEKFVNQYRVVIT